MSEQPAGAGLMPAPQPIDDGSDPPITAPQVRSSAGEAWDVLEEILWTLGANRQDEAETYPETTIGRVEAIGAIRDCIARGRHVLITGTFGTGKSHLLRHTARELVAGDKYLWLDDFKAQKSLLKDIGLELHEAGHLARYQEETDADRVGMALDRMRISELLNIVVTSLRGRGYVILIDNLETIPPSGLPSLRALSENATIVAACNSEKIGRIAALVDRFNQVELGPMAGDEIKTLLWMHLDPETVADPPMLERRVIAQANGIPRVAVDASHKLAGRASLADIRDVRATIPTTTRVDLTWIIVLAVAGLVAMRYVARATDSTTTYVVFGVLSAFAMVARILLPKLSRERV